MSECESVDRQEETVGEFLIRRLAEAGCSDVFGVPGDFVLGFMSQILRSKKVNFVGTCNELNAAYAADGYARVKGLGCVVTTYTVGELSALNGVAGSYAESVPVVAITGAPTTTAFRNRPLLHHTLGDYQIPQTIFKQVSVEAVNLLNRNTACEEIDRVLTICLREKRPVYISLPCDMAAETVCAPKAPFKFPTLTVSHEPSLNEAIDEIVTLLRKAKMPLCIPGVELTRRGLSSNFRGFIEATGIPFCTMMLSKGIVDETHPLFLGLYNGSRSRQSVLDRIKKADCILIFGEKLTDFNTGGFTAHLDADKLTYIHYSFVQIRYHTYHDVYIQDVLERLTKSGVKFDPMTQDIHAAKDGCVHRANVQYIAEPTAKLTMARFFFRMAHFIREDAFVIAETGASLFSAAETMMPKGTKFFGQTFYGSIGYTIGATLGMCQAAKSTPVYLFIGDGSFQVTCQDLSTMIRNKLKPFIFLVNNDGYTIERVIIDDAYNDIQMWDYAGIPEVFGGVRGIKVKTEGELEEALVKAEKLYDQGTLPFIEIFVDKMDCSPLLKLAGDTMAKANRLRKVSEGGEN